MIFLTTVKSDDLGMKFVSASLGRTEGLWQPVFSSHLCDVVLMSVITNYLTRPSCFIFQWTVWPDPDIKTELTTQGVFNNNVIIR